MMFFFIVAGLFVVLSYLSVWLIEIISTQILKLFKMIFVYLSTVWKRYLKK